MRLARFTALLLLTVLACVLTCTPALAAKDKTPNAAESSAAPKKGSKKSAKKNAKKSDPKVTQKKAEVGPQKPEFLVPQKPDVVQKPAVWPQHPQVNNSAEAPKPMLRPGAANSKNVGPGIPPEPNLPSIAQDQPGFIPDRTPEDLFQRPLTQTPRERYRSLLGESKLPPGDVPTIIGTLTQTPGLNLMENQARLHVPDGSIEGSIAEKKFKVRGGVIIVYNGVEITAEDADIDEKGETALLKQNVEIVDPNYTLKTNELRIFFGKKKFEALGFVQFTKNAKPESNTPNLSLPKKDRLRESFSAQQFELYCNKLYYDWGSKELTALQAVRMEHPSFSGTMERLDYNDKTKTYAMEGGVGLNVADYAWIFKNQLVDAKDEKKVQSVTDAPTKITADKVTFSDETAIAQFYALNGKQVVMDQTKRKVTSNYMEINDKTKDFYAEGSDSQPAVFDQTSGEWLLESGMISKQDASEDLTKMLAKPLSAKARTITFNYDRKRLEMRSGVEVKNDEQQLTAGEMIQDETAKFFLVRDNVSIKTDAKTEMRAAQVYVDTANDVYTFVGMVTGKGSGEAAGLPSMQPGGEFGEAGAQPGLGPNQPIPGGETGTPRLGQPGLFQEVR